MFSLPFTFKTHSNVAKKIINIPSNSSNNIKNTMAVNHHSRFIHATNNLQSPRHFETMTDEKRFKIKPLCPHSSLLEKVLVFLEKKNHKLNSILCSLYVTKPLCSLINDQTVWNKQNHGGDMFVYISNQHPEYTTIESQSNFKLDCSFVSPKDKKYYLLYFGSSSKSEIEIEFKEFIQQEKNFKFTEIYIS